ncbi:uncharacterized protein LOC144508387 isoform X2 [Mustelus asterias]
MGGPLLTAVAVCSFIIEAEPQSFTIQTENSQMNVMEEGNAFFSVKPSAAVKSGSWEFQDGIIAQWLGPNFTLRNDYKDWSELFLPNGSLLLKSVTVSDSGKYTVRMVPETGNESTATITLNVFDPLLKVQNLNLGAIIGITSVPLILGLIIGISAWLIKRKACGRKNSTQEQEATNSNAKANDPSAAIGESSAATYENIPRKQKEQASKSLDENSAYMDLQLQDRSVYGQLMRP